MSKFRPVDHHMYKYATKKKDDTQEVEVDGKTYIITIPSGNQFRAMEKSGKDFKQVYDYLKENYQTRKDGTMIFDKEEGHIFEPHIRAIRKGFTETGLGWGKNCKFWYDNLFLHDKAPELYEKQMYVAISPAETLRKTTKKKEKAKTIEDLKPGESIELDEGDIVFGDEILPPITQYVPVKKVPIQTRKEFTERIKAEKERHYKEFLESYYKYGVDSLGTTKSYVASRRPFGEEAEALYYVFKDKDSEAWNKIVKEHPELAKHKKLLRDPKEFFENFYYLESESEPSEGFLSSEEDIESESDLEKEEENIEKMHAPEPTPTPPSGGKKTRKRNKISKKYKMKKSKKTKHISRQRGGKRTKKKKSTRKKRRGGVAPPGPRRPTNQPVERPPLTRTPRLPSMFEIRDPLEQISNRRYSYENSENFINRAFDILTDFDTMVYVVSRSGHTSPYDDTPLDDFFRDVIINNFSTAVENDPRHVDTIRRRLGMGTEQIGNIINAIQRREGALTPREGALRPSEKIQRYMDILATLGDDPMDVEGGKRRKKKKSTRKKKRGGVRPDSPRSDTSSDGPNQNRTMPQLVLRPSRVLHAPPLVQELNRARELPTFYIEIALQSLSNPQIVWQLNHEGRLDNIMDLVLEDLRTFFVNREGRTAEREAIRGFLNELEVSAEVLEEVDIDLVGRYEDFIEQIHQLAGYNN